jgi:hypothetical protein
VQISFARKVSRKLTVPLILNLIERFWKFLKRKVTRNRFYATFAEFRTAVQTILNNIAASGDELASLLIERFQLFIASSDKPVPLTLGRRYPWHSGWHAEALLPIVMLWYDTPVNSHAPVYTPARVRISTVRSCGIISRKRRRGGRAAYRSTLVRAAQLPAHANSRTQRSAAGLGGITAYSAGGQYGREASV